MVDRSISFTVEELFDSIVLKAKAKRTLYFAFPFVGQLASTVEEDEFLEMLLIQLLCNLSGFKNNQQKLGESICLQANAHD